MTEYVWHPVEELYLKMDLGDQLDVLFGSPTWSWPILGMVTLFKDGLVWSIYDQINDKFVDWDSKPTLYMIRPDLPRSEESLYAI